MFISNQLVPIVVLKIVMVMEYVKLGIFVSAILNMLVPTAKLVLQIITTIQHALFALPRVLVMDMDLALLQELALVKLDTLEQIVINALRIDMHIQPVDIV